MTLPPTARAAALRGAVGPPDHLVAAQPETAAGHRGGHRQPHARLAVLPTRGRRGHLNASYYTLYQNMLYCCIHGVEYYGAMAVIHSNGMW